MTSSPIERVAVIGTGVIGASWATLFLSRGLDVTAFDVAPNTEVLLRDAISRQWPMMQKLGVSDGASIDRLTCCATLQDAVHGVQFVQESGPERLAFKQDVFAALDTATDPTAILASSTSTLRVSEFQNVCSHPDRVVLGHPFNPPHLIPLVEVAGGLATSSSAIDAAISFYAACGKRPIRLQREIRGHIANRLQAALWQEAFHLVSSGVATVSDIDDAIAHGPGLRWALLGPFLNMHLSGGSGGLAHVLAHLGPAMEAIWDDLGKASLTPECKSVVIAGLADELGRRDSAALTAERDRLLIGLLQAKAASAVA